MTIKRALRCREASNYLIREVLDSRAILKIAKVSLLAITSFSRTILMVPELMTLTLIQSLLIRSCLNCAESLVVVFSQNFYAFLLEPYQTIIHQLGS